MLRRARTVAGTFAAAGRSRNNNFDFLRCALALMVLFSHCYPLTYSKTDYEPLYRATGGHEDLGRIALAGFFILSGFLIANSWASSAGLWDFLWRRALRIYPGFIVAVLFTAFVVGPFAMVNGFPLLLVMRRTARALITVNDPYLPGMFAHNPLFGWGNGSLWTIWYELVCYLLIAALGVMGLIRRPWAIFGLFIFAIAVCMTADYVSTVPAEAWGGWAGRLQGVFVKKMTWFMGPRLYMFFLAGSCFWAFRDRIPKSWVLALLCAAGLVGVTYFGRMPLHAALPILGVYLLLWVAFNDAIPFHRFGKYGDFSYGLYLYAFPVTQSVVCLTHARFAAPVLAMIVLPITFVLAFTSWHLVERPFLRLKRKSVPLPDSEAAAAQARGNQGTVAAR
jgi:peptidoglycan/LPS O-acetylase OafA/YrhL